MKALTFLKKKALLGVLALALGAAGVGLWLRGREQNDEFLTAKVARGSIGQTITATGSLQAVTTVQVGAQVTGRIQALYADFNSIVKQGQVLALIDPSNFQAQKERAEAGLATALAAVKSGEALLANRQAELNSVKANLEAARVARDDQQRLLRRSRELSASGLLSERDLESVQAAADQAAARFKQIEAQLEQAEAQVRSARAQLEQARAQVLEARAALRMAEVNLQYTEIRSPIDGVVIERNVDVGQTVAASLQAPTLFVIANDLRRMQVTANVDEADIGAISEKAVVEFTVDAFAGEVFRGRVSEIRLNARTVQNVVTYNVIIDVPNPQLKLRPGMTANISFIVARMNGVLKIPNAALRWRPESVSQDEVAKLMAEAAGSAKSDQGPRRADAGVGPAPIPDEERRRRLERRMRQEGSDGPDGRPPWREASRFRREGGGAGAGPRALVEAGEKIRFPQIEPARERWQVVWVLGKDRKPEPRPVLLGITDGRETAAVDGKLAEGDLIILGESSLAERQPAGATRAPIGPAAPWRGRR